MSCLVSPHTGKNTVVVCSPIPEDDRHSPMGHDELALFAICSGYANGLWPPGGLTGELSYWQSLLELEMWCISLILVTPLVLLSSVIVIYPTLCSAIYASYQTMKIKIWYLRPFQFYNFLHSEYSFFVALTSPHKRSNYELASKLTENVEGSWFYRMGCGQKLPQHSMLGDLVRS